jgi:hypothetical protein
VVVDGEKEGVCAPLEEYEGVGKLEPVGEGVVGGVPVTDAVPEGVVVELCVTVGVGDGVAGTPASFTTPSVVPAHTDPSEPIQGSPTTENCDALKPAGG